MLAYNEVNLKNPQGKRRAEQGFTLIELSIVLVIIGLIVGGVLVGQDLIRAAEVRATITQIEKYNTAVNTFRVKFNSLPGDMAASTAAQFGFTTRGGTTAGHGDGNGAIEGDAASTNGLYQGVGETGLFWEDLSSTAGGNLIDGGFTTASDTTAVTTASVTYIANYLPPARLGKGNYISVFWGSDGTTPPANFAGYNWYGLSDVSAITSSQETSTANLPVIQAYNIDKKVDDGLPTTGNVEAYYLTGGVITATAHAAVSPGAATDCYASDTKAYAILENNGGGGNCALAFKFQ